MAVHTQPGKVETERAFPGGPQVFFLLVWFLLIPFNSQLPPRMEWSQHPGDWLPAGVLGRRSPAAVEESVGSSKGQN